MVITAEYGDKSVVFMLFNSDQLALIMICECIVLLHI